MLEVDSNVYWPLKFKLHATKLSCLMKSSNNYKHMATGDVPVHTHTIQKLCT